MQIMQCNKDWIEKVVAVFFLTRKRWLQLVGLGSNGGARARARPGDSHGWMALHVFIPHSL
jgi:hypothetical protein